MAQEFPFAEFLRTSQAIADKEKAANPNMGAVLGNALGTGISAGISSGIDEKRALHQKYADMITKDKSPYVVGADGKEVLDIEAGRKSYENMAIGKETIKGLPGMAGVATGSGVIWKANKQPSIQMDWVKDKEGKWVLQPSTDSSGNLVPANNKINYSPEAAAEAAGQKAGAVAAAQAPYKAPIATLTPAAIDNAADIYNKTGNLPAMGRGGDAMRGAILNKAAEKLKAAGKTAEANLVERQAFQADTSSLKNLTKLKDQVFSFEQTANKNLDIALNLSDRADRTGSPVINRWLQAGKKSIAGDPDVAAFDAAIRTAINEVAKVTSGASGGAITSDSARHEIESQLNSYQTVEQVKSVIGVLKQDMSNRRAGIDSQIYDIRGRLDNKPSALPEQGQPAASGIQQPQPQTQPKPSDKIQQLKISQRVKQLQSRGIPNDRIANVLKRKGINPSLYGL